MSQTEPFWWDDAGAPTSPEAQALPEEVDVLVIGAGLTGLSAARTLARAGKSVLALDAKAPGIGGSSCNGGMIGGGHLLSLDELGDKYGQEMALTLIREAQLHSTAFAKELIAEEDISCDLAVNGRFRGLWSRSEHAEAGRELDRLKKHLPVDAEMVPPGGQVDHIATDLYTGGIVYPQHGGLNPAKYVAGLLAAAQKHGAVVQGDTPVQAVSTEGSSSVVETGRGTVRAGAVLAATNGYTPKMLSYAKRRVVPVPSFIVATEPLGEERVRSLIPQGQMITESRDRHCYYRPSPDGTRLVFGGRAAMTGVPDGFARSQLGGLIGEILPELADVELTHSWRGFAGFTFEFLPNIGRYDGVWHAIGYSGNGNTMAPYLGHKVALQILGDPEGETAFSNTEFPARWWHQGYPWFLPFADVLFRMKDVRSRVFRKK
ncbi:MAG: FAD-binding oxidoreductase [Actinomycetia bacterium]|nr:FAD-binding oxidoreductase [Actinomycetes bacterium]MCP5035447.1 FAD-binding oxidoreductase [Actinomycetes bacterium]